MKVRRPKVIEIAFSEREFALLEAMNASDREEGKNVGQGCGCPMENLDDPETIEFRPVKLITDSIRRRLFQVIPELEEELKELREHQAEFSEMFNAETDKAKMYCRRADDFEALMMKMQKTFANEYRQEVSENQYNHLMLSQARLDLFRLGKLKLDEEEREELEEMEQLMRKGYRGDMVAASKAMTDLLLESLERQQEVQEGEGQSH
jgi:hypothetical protein